MSAQRWIARRARISRPLLGALALALALVLLAHPLAAGSDALANVAPASQLPGGSLTNAYPLGNYALDHHFDAVSASLTGGVDASGIAPTIAWFLAQLLWSLTAFLANAVITLFTFAFSLDLVNGSAATGGAGALAPVGVAVRSIYRDTFGEPWLVVAILLTGLWAIWHALVRRKYTETAGALGVSLLFVVIALALVARPEIVGQASKWTNRMSGAFLALSTQGSLGGEQQAKQADADQLFSLLVYDPWAVLDFGGIEHCVTTTGGTAQSVSVRPLSRDAARDGALSRQLAAGTQVQADGKVCINNRNKYASHFLRFAPETDQRNAEYDALSGGDSGKLPDADPAKAGGGYRLGDVDKPAADAMGKGGQYQRLLLAIVIFLGELGAFALLGSASVVVIVAQVLVLLLLAFAPVALVVGVIPRRGHEFFTDWLSRLGDYLLRKAIYSLIIAVLLAVNGALADATSSLGWLLAFGLQAVFNWTVFLNRRRLLGGIGRTATGHGRVESDGLARAALVSYAAARVATRQLRRGGGERAGGERPGQRAGSRSGGETPPDPGSAGPDAPQPGGPSAPPAAPSGVPQRPRPNRPAPAAAQEPPAAAERAAATPTPASQRAHDETQAPTPVAGPASAGQRDVREDRRARAGKPAGAEHARRARRGGGSAGESALRRGLHQDARRLRRESHRLREEAQQLADEGRRLRSGARHAHPAPAPAASPRGAALPASPIEPASPPPAPLDSAGEETRA